jgi:hypothetical protein
MRAIMAASIAMKIPAGIGAIHVLPRQRPRLPSRAVSAASFLRLRYHEHRRKGEPSGSVLRAFRAASVLDNRLRLDFEARRRRYLAKFSRPKTAHIKFCEIKNRLSFQRRKAFFIGAIGERLIPCSAA